MKNIPPTSRCSVEGTRTEPGALLSSEVSVSLALVLQHHSKGWWVEMVQPPQRSRLPTGATDHLRTSYSPAIKYTNVTCDIRIAGECRLVMS